MQTLGLPTAVGPMTTQGDTGKPVGMYLTLIDEVRESELARVELVHTGSDINDDEVMAALGRKLWTWIKETKEEYEAWKAEQDRLCNCFSKDKPWTDFRKTSHSSSCRVMFDCSDEEYEKWLSAEEGDDDDD